MAKTKTEAKTEVVIKGLNPGLVKNQLDGDYDFTNKMINSAVLRFDAGAILTVIFDRDTGIYGTWTDELDGGTQEWHAEFD